MKDFFHENSEQILVALVFCFCVAALVAGSAILAALGGRATTSCACVTTPLETRP